MRARITTGGVFDHRDLLQPLLEEHVAELATYPELMSLSPDWSRYESAEGLDMLHTLYAWVGDELVGYSCTFVTPHLHYSALRYASNDVLFVSKAHRASRVGLQLINATEALVQKAGARLMLWHAKPGTPLDTLLHRRRYKVQDLIYSRELPEVQE